MIANTCTHRSLQIAALVCASALTLLAAPSLSFAQTSTAWGWPLPYERVSDKSMQWLKDKGWWPIQVAFQAPWSGQNTVNIVMDRQELLKKRGVEAKWQAFPSGPAINEVVVSARFQVGSGGNFLVGGPKNSYAVQPISVRPLFAFKLASRTR